MKPIKILIHLILIIILLTFVSMPVTAATPPDIIHQMTVTITPQSNGSLNIKYELDYEATTDFPTDIQYLEVGVPNSDFTLLGYGHGPSSLISNGHENKNGTSQVHLDFISLPKAGDRFSLDFTILQRSMVYDAGDNVSFQFRPGWFDFAVIDEMRVIVDTKDLINSQLDPVSDEMDGKQAIWITRSMDVNEKAGLVTVTCGRDSFPNMSNEIVKYDPSEGSYSSGESYQSQGPGINVGGILTFVFTGIIVVLSIIGRSGRGSYYAGRYGGGYRGGFFGGHSTFHGGGGIGGGGGGHGCACACACAGGGRVGCSERGYQVMYWLIRHKNKAQK